MIMVRYCLFIAMLCSCLRGQSQSWDSSYQTTYYDQKLTLFRLLPDTKGEIVFLGNSITDIGEWSEIWQNPTVKNRGISGDITFGVLARLDEVLSSKPKKLFGAWPQWAVTQIEISPTHSTLRINVFDIHLLGHVKSTPPEVRLLYGQQHF